MKLPRIPRRWRLRTLMIVVAACALGLAAYHEYVLRGPIYWELFRLRFGGPSARSDAVTRLGLLRPRAPFADEAVIRALGDPDRSVRADAMYSLIRLGWRSPRLLPILAEAIEDTPEPRRWAWRTPAAWNLGEPPKGWVFSDGGLYDNNPRDALNLIRPDARAFVPLLAKALKSPADWVRSAAINALFAVATWSDPSGPELADALLAVLDDYRLDPRVVDIEARGQLWDRHRAAEALARLDCPARDRAVARLVADLRDLDSPRSYEAVALLRQFEGGKALVVSNLRDHIRDGDEDRRRIAMLLLGHFGEAAAPAAPDLLRVITGPGADRRSDPRDGPLFRRLRWWGEAARSEQGWESTPRVRLDGPYSDIKIGVGVLKVMGAAVEHRAIGELIAMARDQGADPHRRRCVLLALGQFGPDADEAIPALAEVIRAHEEAHRRSSQRFAEPDSPGALATAALGRIAEEGNPEAIAILSRLVEATDATVGANAAMAISFLGPKAKAAVPALVKGLKDPRQGVRFWCSEALGKIGGPEVRAVLPALMDALDDEDRFVRIHAAQAVSAYGTEAKAAVPKIADLLWGSGPEFEVARSLGRIGPDAAVAIPPLLYWDVEKPMWSVEVREAMETIMPRTPGATVAGSIAAMKAGDPAARARASYELGRLIEEPPHPDEAIAALGAALDDPDPLVRRMAAAVLGRLGPAAEAARPSLTPATRDPDGSVRKLAAWALDRAHRRSVPATMVPPPGHRRWRGLVTAVSNAGPIVTPARADRLALIGLHYVVPAASRRSESSSLACLRFVSADATISRAWISRPIWIARSSISIPRSA